MMATRPDSPAPLACLPFRLMRQGGVPYVEGVALSAGSRLVARFYQGSGEFAAVTLLMEQYRELERAAAGRAAEREAIRGENDRLRAEVGRVNAKLAELERRLSRNMKAKGAE